VTRGNNNTIERTSTAGQRGGGEGGRKTLLQRKESKRLKKNRGVKKERDSVWRREERMKGDNTPPEPSIQERIRGKKKRARILC